MNKGAIKRILQYTNEDSIPLAILGVIEGIIEEWIDSKYATTFEVCEEVLNAIEAWKDLKVDKSYLILNEPQLSE